MTAATEIQDIRVRPLGRGTFIGGIFVTILIHAALVGLVWYGQMKEPPREEKEREIILTEMVKLGKPREKFWLPRIVEAPPPPPVEPTIKVADDPFAKPVEREKEKEKPPEKPPDMSKKVQDVLNKRRAMLNAASEPEEGLETGSARGTSNVATEGDPYLSSVRDRIRENWNVPQGLTMGQAVNLETKVRIQIESDGTLLEPKIVTPSGNSLFDATCVQAVQATRRVAPPPPEKRALYRRGIALLMEGKDLAR